MVENYKRKRGDEKKKSILRFNAAIYIKKEKVAYRQQGERDILLSQC